jgi:alpha-beta hydrolase superfamily lysophospholipase
MRWISVLTAAAIATAPVAAETITTTAADGTTVYGETYFGALPETAPMIALFHQARSNGRGEYAPLIPWLNGLGYRVIAFDQRSGGDLYGETNRTAAAAKGPKGFCDAWPDVDAGVAYAHEAANGAPLVIWGSSYSASLIWRAAATHADGIDGVVAVSTATGGPLDSCGARAYLPKLKDRAVAVWPEKEKGQADRLKTLLDSGNVAVVIVKGGVHGSSTLVDARTGKDMSGARAAVAGWLETFTKGKK